MFFSHKRAQFGLLTFVSRAKMPPGCEGIALALLLFVLLEQVLTKKSLHVESTNAHQVG